MLDKERSVLDNLKLYNESSVVRHQYDPLPDAMPIINESLMSQLSGCTVLCLVAAMLSVMVSL